MNPVPTRLLSLTVVCAALPLFVACNKQERAEAGDKAKAAYVDTKDKAKELYNDTKDKTVEMYDKSRAAVASQWAKLKAYTYEKRDEFTSSSKALEAEMDAQVSKLKAKIDQEQASASRKAALDELKNAEADYKQKLSALGSATSATWDSAKSSVVAAWDRWEASYRKALAD